MKRVGEHVDKCKYVHIKDKLGDGFRFPTFSKQCAYTPMNVKGVVEQCEHHKYVRALWINNLLAICFEPLVETLFW